MTNRWKQKQQLHPRVNDYLEEARRLQKLLPDEFCITLLQRELKIGYSLAKQLTQELTCE